MHENRYDECGVLGVLKYKPDALKLTESCCAEGGCNPCSKFATLQAQAEEAEKTLITLRAAQQSLIPDINFHHSTFIRDIPSEVVCIIFGFCRDPAIEKPSEEPQSRRFCMLTLGAVCKKWREIAWATPELWTFLQMLDIPESDCSSSFSLQIELAKEWLGRTANLPLNISLETRGSRRSYPRFDPRVGELIYVLNSYSGRWQSLDIYIPVEYLPLFHNLPSESAQNGPGIFQHLQLDGSHFDHDNKRPIPFNPDGDLLKPTKVVLGPLHIRLLKIHWGNVTSLNCSALFVDEFLALLRFAPNMTDFTFGIVEGRDYEGLYPIPDAPLAHSQLRKLKITQLQTPMITRTDSYAVTMNTLFSKLMLPSLESFSCEFSFERGIVRWMRRPLLDFFARSLPPLRYLSLSKVTMTSEEFSLLMTCAPLLEEVEIMLEEKTYCFNDFLKPLDAGQTLLRHELPIFRIPTNIKLPQLRSIKYVYRGHTKFCFDGITELFGKKLGHSSSDYDDGDVMRFGDAYREPLQSLIITIEHQPRHIARVYQLALLGKEAVECLLNLREKEGKTIEITQAGIDLIKPPGSVDLDAFG